MSDWILLFSVLTAAATVIHAIRTSIQVRNDSVEDYQRRKAQREALDRSSHQDLPHE